MPAEGGSVAGLSPLASVSHNLARCVVRKLIFIS